VHLPATLTLGPGSGWLRHSDCGRFRDMPPSMSCLSLAYERCFRTWDTSRAVICGGRTRNPFPWSYLFRYAGIILRSNRNVVTLSKEGE
jgi:hypothetical protein